MPPKISIIIPIFNAGRTLRQCLEALCAQDYPSDCYEMIVVDNNSKDNTVQIAQAFPGIRLLSQSEVQSSYATRNLGALHATGEILAFTDGDCVPAQNWLKEFAAAFENPEVLAAGGSVQDAEAGNLVEAFIRDAGPLRNYYNAPAQFFRPLITANAAVRKSAFEALGGFRQTLYTGADIDFAWRLQIKYGSCLRYANSAVVYHHHRSSLRAMFRQYRRHGFGEVFLDAMFQRYPGYPRKASFQSRRLLSQSLAVLNNLKAFAYRLLKYPFHKNRPYLLQPFFWTVAESGNILGKVQGLWATRWMRVDPSTMQWQDPGG